MLKNMSAALKSYVGKSDMIQKKNKSLWYPTSRPQVKENPISDNNLAWPQSMRKKMNTWNYLKKRTYRAGRRTQECQEFHTFSANSGMSGMSHLFGELRNVRNVTPFWRTQECQEFHTFRENSAVSFKRPSLNYY